MSASRSILKQLLGATVGMTVALALYSAYEAANPMVAAYLLPPGVTDGSEVSSDIRVNAALSEQSDKYQRIGARAREIAERLGDTAVEGTANAATMEEEVTPSVIEPETFGDLQESAEDRREARELQASLFGETEDNSQLHSGAPKLPSSGRAMDVFAVLCALIAAAGLHPKVRLYLRSLMRAAR
jgi:hypothetical protein